MASKKTDAYTLVVSACIQTARQPRPISHGQNREESLMTK